MKDLLLAAQHAARHAYAPYSHFKVGAAVRTASGRVFSGCNVENAAYPLGHCAERSAIAAAVGEEGGACQIIEVAVHAEDELGVAQPAPPCGACRQCIHELGAKARVHFLSPNGEQVTQGIEDLLPFAFKLRRAAT
ncbi:cytidine deaminase [Pseudomarimonas arenosa]|nr:cytidine deaminase [Pseudomarimonas arenosa]